MRQCALVARRNGFGRRRGPSSRVSNMEKSSFRVCFASWSDRHRQRENSARLRALRDSQAPNLPPGMASDGSDYRCRKEHEEGRSDSIEDVWGEAAHATESKPKERKGRKFVPLFKEIDAIMEARTRKNETKNTSSTLDSFDHEVKKEETPADLKSLLQAWKEEHTTPSETNMQQDSSITSLESIFDSIGDPPQEVSASQPTENSNGLNSTLQSLNETAPLGTEHEQRSEASLSSSVDSILHSSETIQDNRKESLFDTESTRSIFDAFPVPEPPPPRSPDAFEEEAYTEYVSMLNLVLDSNKFGRRHTKKGLSDEHAQSVETWLRMEEKTLEYDLPLLKAAVSLPPSQETVQGSTFRQELQKQKESFLEKMEWTEAQYDAAKWALVVVGQRCAKLAQSTPLDVAWEKVKEAGMVLDHNSLNAFLYACTTYGSMRRRGNCGRGLLGGVGAESPILDILGHPTALQEDGTDVHESEDNDDGVPEEVATFHDLLYEPTEQSLSIRVRGFVAKGDGKAAEELLESFPSEQGDLRHRTYLPVLRLYMEKGDIASALRIFKTMRESAAVFFEPETYVQLISGIAEHGFFSSDSDPIDGASNLGYSPAYGPQLFDQLAAEMGEDILEISSASARRLYTAFWTAHKDHEMAEKMQEIPPLAPLALTNNLGAPGELIVSRVSVDAATGVCPRSGAKLRLMNLERGARKQLHDRLLELSMTSFGEFKQKIGHTELEDDYAAKALADFTSWLENRQGKPFTTIVDGANVAYYMQNFDQGKFNFHQIQFMVDTLEQMNETPLVILPFKYQQQYFKIVRGSGYDTQVPNQREREILEKLIESGKLYVVPRFCLDDFYWMLASVSEQTTSREGVDLTVSPGNEAGRWAGTRPMLVTNDQMRDHKLSLLEPRLFRRWYSCHIVNYNFTGFVDDECVDHKIGFSPADFFSREIQGNPTPSVDGDMGGGTAWHFPVSDWELNERFCVRIPE